MAKLFVLYDGRARFGDTEDASIMTTAESEGEAIGESQDWEDVDGIWYEYDVKGKTLVNETMRPDIGQGILA